jgi:hypothetical protein
MSHRSKLIVTAVLLVLLGGLGAADVYLSSNQIAANLPMPTDDLGSDDGTQVSSLPTDGPIQGVAKRRGVNIEQTLSTRGFEVELADERSMLEQMVDTTAVQVNAMSILKDGDRIGAVAWIEDANVKDQFLSLKDALLAAFSPDVQDLEDVTRADPGMPIRNEVTFLDSALSEERITVVRVGERLYEFHTVLGKEEQMRVAIDALSTL